MESNYAAYHLLKTFAPTDLDSNVHLVCTQICLAVVKPDKQPKKESDEIQFRAESEESEDTPERLAKTEILTLADAMDMMAALEVR